VSVVDKERERIEEMRSVDLMNEVLMLRFLLNLYVIKGESSTQSVRNYYTLISSASVSVVDHENLDMTHETFEAYCHYHSLGDFLILKC